MRNEISNLYKENYQPLVNYLRSITKSQIISEEIASETFMKVFKNFHLFDPSVSSAKTWIFAIAKNTLIDYYKSHKVSKTKNISYFTDSDGNEIFEIASEENTFENYEIKKAIQKAINELRPEYRNIAYLFFIEQRKQQEIAEICNTTIYNVKVVIYRCKNILQSKLKSFVS